jgi:hypothetical protein
MGLWTGTAIGVAYDGGTALTATRANGQLLSATAQRTRVATLTPGLASPLQTPSGFITIASTGLINPMTTLGDIIYRGATSGTAPRLAGETTTTRSSFDP